MKTEAELKKLSKVKLEEYARNEGIELDRRKTKANMIADYLSSKSSNTPDESNKPVKDIIIKTPDDVVKEEKEAVAKAEGDQQLQEFKDFIKDIESSEVGNPTMWMLGKLGKYVQNHKVKCTKDPETGKVTIESEGPSINGIFELK